MRIYFLFFLLLLSAVSNGQINRMVKLNIGFTRDQMDYKRDIQNFNDTSDHHFEFVSKSPAISYTHEYFYGQILSLSGRLGFQYLNIYYDNQYYGSPLFHFSINPALTLVSLEKFEYYLKLQVGVNYRFIKPELINNSSIPSRTFPEKLNIYAGVTIGGFHYYLNDKWGLNAELSIWAQEVLTFGLTYRFLKGDLPTMQELDQLEEL